MLKMYIVIPKTKHGWYRDGTSIKTFQMSRQRSIKMTNGRHGSLSRNLWDDGIVLGFRNQP